MRTLTIPVKGIYFDQIKAGTKHEEFRLVTGYWTKRLRGRAYDRIVLTRGYPKADDDARRLVLPWRGYRVTVIKHEHFGPEPVKVFAINVRSPDTEIEALFEGRAENTAVIAAESAENSSGAGHD